MMVLTIKAESIGVSYVHEFDTRFATIHSHIYKSLLKTTIESLDVDPHRRDIHLFIYLYSVFFINQFFCSVFLCFGMGMNEIRELYECTSRSLCRIWLALPASCFAPDAFQTREYESTLPGLVE